MVMTADFESAGLGRFPVRPNINVYLKLSNLI